MRLVCARYEDHEMIRTILHIFRKLILFYYKLKLLMLLDMHEFHVSVVYVPITVKLNIYLSNTKYKNLLIRDLAIT